jgi:hypothetical protein
MSLHSKRFYELLFAVAVALTVSVTAAHADGIVTVGGPSSFPTYWSQEWNESGVGNFDNLELFIETTGVYFSDAGSANDDGWTASLVNPQYVYMAGEDVTNLNFNLDFITDPSVPLTVDLYTTCNNADAAVCPVIGAIDSVIMSYDGLGGWTNLGPAPGLGSENTAPEPTTFVLMGTALIGVGIRLRRKKRASYTCPSC